MYLENRKILYICLGLFPQKNRGAGKFARSALNFAALQELGCDVEVVTSRDQVGGMDLNVKTHYLDCDISWDLFKSSWRTWERWEVSHKIRRLALTSETILFSEHWPSLTYAPAYLESLSERTMGGITMFLFLR